MKLQLYTNTKIHCMQNISMNLLNPIALNQILLKKEKCASGRLYMLMKYASYKYSRSNKTEKGCEVSTEFGILCVWCLGFPRALWWCFNRNCYDHGALTNVWT